MAAAMHARGFKRDWANLTSGPVGLISERVLSNSVADYIRFRAVCTAWRACSADPRALGVFDRGWIMLPHAFDIHDRLCLLNVFAGWCIHFRLPLLHRRYVLGQTTNGLLVLCWKFTHVIHLLNPLTGKLVNLPPAENILSPVMEFKQNFQVRSAAVADDGMVALQFGFCSLITASPDHEQWTWLDLGDEIKSMISFAGRIYCATTKEIMVVETAAHSKKRPQLVKAAEYELGEETASLLQLSLVDNDGVLVLVAYQIANVGEQQQMTCKVYRVDLHAGKTVIMPGLGGRAVFISDRVGDRALSVSAGLSTSICADTVYLCSCYDEETGRAEVDACHLLDGRIDMDCRRKCAPSMVDYLAKLCGGATLVVLTYVQCKGINGLSSTGDWINTTSSNLITSIANTV